MPEASDPASDRLSPAERSHLDAGTQRANAAIRSGERMVRTFGFTSTTRLELLEAALLAAHAYDTAWEAYVDQESEGLDSVDQWNAFIDTQNALRTSFAALGLVAPGPRPRPQPSPAS
jgi:hypothetical protein